jgi:concanavalin A-like lectin/glucanase superfamily protein
LSFPIAKVAVAFGVNPFTTPAGGQWIDVSAYVRQITTGRGRSHELARSQAGILTIRLDNTDRRFDPENSSSPYWPNVIPGVRVRFQGQLGASTYDEAQGFVESWEQLYPPAPTGNIGDAECVLTVVDAFKLFGLFDLQAYSAEVLQDGPLGYWRLRELMGSTVASDEGGGSGGPFDGTYTGGVTLEAAGPLFGGSPAASFDGVDDFVDMGTLVPFKLQSDMTLEAWVYPTGITADRTIVSLGDCGKLQGSSHGGTGVIQYRQTDGGGSAEQFITADGTLTANVWTHLALVRQGTLISVYKNGVLLTTFNIQQGPRNTNSRLQVGADWNGAQIDWWPGRLAHVAVFDHALTAERVAAHFARGADTFVAQDTGSFINAILDTIGWPAGERTIDVGSSTIQELTPSGPALDLMLAAAEDTENGLLQIDGAGKVIFHSRQSLWKAPHNTVQAVFGDGETQPPELTGLIGWWKADSLGLNDGDAVSSWADSSGGGNTASQGTGTRQPIYKASMWKGLPIIRFDGSNDRLDLTTHITAGPISIFAVVSKASAQSGARVVISLQKIGLLARVVGLDDWEAFVNAGLDSGQSITGAYLRICALVARSFNDVDLYTDGAGVTRTTGAAWSANATSSIGDLAAGGAAGAIDLAELIVYNRAVSTPERTRIESYLARKWGIEAVMPWELAYENLVLSYDDHDLYAVAEVQRQGGVLQRAQDATAKTRYTPRTLRRTGLLMNSDADALGAAQFFVRRYKDPYTRPVSVHLLGAAFDSILVQLLSRETHGDRIAVRRRPPGGGPLISVEAHIEGVEHNVTPGESWETTWKLVPAVTANFWLLGDPVWGILDSSTRLGY